jgi:hypothetical protein
MVGISEVPKPLREAESQRGRRRNWVHAADGLPGVSEDDVPIKTEQRKHGTTHGSAPSPYPPMNGNLLSHVLSELPMMEGSN